LIRCLHRLSDQRSAEFLFFPPGPTAVGPFCCPLAARLTVAVAVAVGFLLLIPQLSWAAISDLQQRASSQASLIARATANLTALSQVVASAMPSSASPGSGSPAGLQRCAACRRRCRLA
jgi:hypothetical protein